MKFVDEFKDFISRGNVVDMAVGVVVGGAFKKKVEEEVTPAGPTQEELLAEIRDLLKDKE